MEASRAMKRSVHAVLALLLLVILISSVGLYVYRVELVWVVVKNDLAQKAPAGCPKAHIDAVFDEVLQRRRSGAAGHEDLLARLFDLSQRLEKTQYLTPEECDRMLKSLAEFR